jgi:hypothetical protein
MFGKRTARTLAHTFRQVRGHVQKAYGTAIKAGTMLDDGMMVARRIHGALKDSGAYTAETSKAIDSGFGKYAGAKKEVSDRHDNVKNTLSRVKAAAGSELTGMF